MTCFPKLNISVFILCKLRNYWGISGKLDRKPEMSVICWLGFQGAHAINLHQEQYWWTEAQGLPIHHIHPGDVSEAQRAVGQGPLCSESTAKKWPHSGLVAEENNPSGIRWNSIFSFRGGRILLTFKCWWSVILNASLLLGLYIGFHLVSDSTDFTEEIFFNGIFVAQ